MSRAIVREGGLTNEVLRAARDIPGWRPWQGARTRARELADKGLLAENGAVYTITDSGSKYLRMQEAQSRRDRKRRSGA
jgi:hypothetical protein